MVRCAARPIRWRDLILSVSLSAIAGLAGAQQPAAPAPPDVITRDAERHATVRAVHLQTPLRVDGRLDEDVYRTTPPITDFIQTLPKANDDPTEKTEAWVMFDGANIYVSARCWDSAPPDKWIANEMRRDTTQLRQNDHFGIVLDTFHDRRNGYIFYANPLGGRSDQTISDEGNPNADWNPVWEVRTGRFEGGWTIEMAIPFKSLRYVSGAGQEWGIQMRRAIRRKNEWAYLTPLPIAIGGPTGFFRVSAAATLVGLELPPASRNIELKPYGITRATADKLAKPADPGGWTGDWGIDTKYGVTANLTADFTYNTDFAQVEVDEQQVNLTRFNLVFPEKRDFFLEGRGLFNFATFPATGSSGVGGSSADTPQLFYSRRIGLNRGRVIPIDVGARLSGKVGGFGIGALNIDTSDDLTSLTPSTNFTVVRVKRDILRRSSFGALFTNRSESAVVPGASNQVYGADANFSFFQNVAFGGYYAKTRTGNLTRDDDSYQGRFDYAPDLYGISVEYLKVGDHFNPEVGFLRRDDFKRTLATARFSPRPKRVDHVRQFTATGTIDYVLNGAGDLESRTQTGQFATEFENSDRVSFQVDDNYELLLQPFPIARGIAIPVGGYNFTNATAAYAFGQQRRASGTLSFQFGDFYDGTIQAYSYTAARVSVLKQLSVEPTISLNRVDLPYGSFTTTLLRARSDYAFTPRRFVSALLQYNTADETFSSNLRFRWEYLPGSELFVVYTDERDTLVPGFPALKNRAFVVKMTKLFRF
jgi:hypothetical protein